MFTIFALNKIEKETISETENFKQQSKQQLKIEIMKTTVKQLAAGTFLAILLTLGNINAKGTELKSSPTKTETTTTKTTTTETIETTIDVEIIIDVENWMVDETVWNINSIFNYEIIEETETGLELEDWMTCEVTWNLTDNIVEETETELIVEDWMLSESIWNKE